MHEWIRTYEQIWELVDDIMPKTYAKTRNYVDGAVSNLSPYISRGIISTAQIYQYLQLKGYDMEAMGKFVQELAWRDYWQQVWIAKEDYIDNDLKHAQLQVSNHQIPEAIIEASTGIDAVDHAISDFYQSGYLHNHIRMYIASIVCNIGQSHWKLPAQWMYYNLLDGDWASNALSWQWVCGSNSNKKYFANQENINTFCHTNQKNTFLECSYDAFPFNEIPDVLKKTTGINLSTTLPPNKNIDIDVNIPTLVYTSYNLDPKWRSELTANRVLLLEPSHFEKYPVSENVISFITGMSKVVDGIQIFCR